MNTLQSTKSALKLLCRGWKNSASTLSKSTVSSQFSTQASYKDSVGKTQPKSESSDSSTSLDPFGIEEIVVSNEKSSILVQGFYSEEERSLPQTPAAPANPTQRTEDAGKNARLQEYGKWLKLREEANQASIDTIPESVRDASFGKIRVDSDNPVTSHGRYDDRYKTTNPNMQQFKLKPSHDSSRRRRPEILQEPYTETIEADYSRRMRASDFLQQYKSQSQTESHPHPSDDSSVDGPHIGSIVINKIVRPRNAPSMDPNHPENVESTKEAALDLDSNVIPKPYLMPDFNAITEQDMWNILRKTVIYENDFILALNKPYGIPIHSKAISCRHTIIQFLKNFAELAKCEEVFPLHRLDKETTGVLLLAKDKKVAAVIKEKFMKRQINKVYLTATKLCPPIREATIKIPVGEGLIPGTKKYRSVLRPDLRDYGISSSDRSCAEAITKYKVLHSIKEAAFLEVELVSGVKHQIRVHLGLGLGCPIIGDHKYSHRDKLAPQRLHPVILHKLKVKQSKVREVPLHLHCNKISFTLPKEFTSSSEPIYIHAKIPYFMRYTLRQLGLIG